MAEYSNISVANTSITKENTVSTTENFKNINFLPELFQTNKLKNFFEGTVEQVFSKPNSEKTTEYIGRRYGSYYRPLKDNYKTEINKNRNDYQLETAIVIKNSDSLQTRDAVFYNELLDFVSTENGKINNQSRLFSQSYYSYGPPIDVDKFLNYENYYWYPPLDSNYSAITIEGVTQSIVATSSQNQFTTSYPVNTATDKVYLKGVLTTDITVVGKTVTLNSATATAGDVLTVTYYIDPDQFIGKKNYTSPNGIELSSGMLITIDPTYFSTSGTFTADTRYYVEGVGTTFGIELIPIDEEAELFLQETFLQWDRADTIGSTDTTKGWDAERWDTIPDIATPDYITIARGSQDKNPWSRTNGWVHKNNVPIYRKVEAYDDTFLPWDDVEGWDFNGTLLWDAQTVTTYVNEAFQIDNSRKGARPIIEFEKDIELYNYGINHLQTVDLLSTEDDKNQIESQVSYSVDGIPLTDGMKILFVNPDFNTSLTPWDSINDPWDHDTDSDASTGGGGGTGGDIGWDVSGSDFDVASSLWQATVNGSSNITLSKVNITVKDGDKVTVKLGKVSGGKEYHWTGYTWLESQTKSKRNVSPLYNLYDHKGISLTDSINYPSSTFTGSPIFGYITGTGANDKALGFPLSYDRYTGLGEIRFKNWHNDYNKTHGFTFYKKYNNPVVLKQNFDKKVLVQPGVSSGNDYYIDGIRKENLILLRNHRYIFDLSDSSTSTTGYTGSSHPMSFSTTIDGTHGSGSAYTTNIKYFLDDVEVTRTDFETSSKFSEASKRRIEFEPDTNTPNTLYYYCPNHAGMGASVFVENNSITQLVDAVTTEYLNQWAVVKDKSVQQLRQEYEVTASTSANTFVLESIVADDSSVRVFVDSLEKQVGTDFNITGNKRIVTTSDVALGSHVIVSWNTFEEKTLKSAYYVAPKNLTHNAENNDIATHSYSDLLDHFGEHIANQTDMTGLALGSNNYRDTHKELSAGDTILQHTAPALKFATHVNTDDRNLVKAIRVAQDDYTRFKNKFIRKTQEVLTKNDISSWSDSKLVDYVLKELNKNQKISDKWSYSLMASYGDTKKTTSTTITATNKTWSNSTSSFEVQSYEAIMDTTGKPGLETSFVFNPKDDKDVKSLYVYNNGVQLTMNHDYVIDNVSTTRIVFIGNNKPQVGDVVKIEYYESKQPIWIPATPSKLGMTKTFLPQQFTDSNSYSSGSKIFTQGHDGSLVLLYNDDRDRALLELEKRIYNDIENRFIDPDYQPPLSYNTLVSNYFNSKLYSYKEYNEIIRSHIYRWAVFNEVDLTTNSNYSSLDWKTWNWGSTTDLSGDKAPGHWRGIYKKFYGTDRPHTHPWEMLGFSIKPTWWDNNYNWTSAGKRALLISDIEKGIIRGGDRANLLNLQYTGKNNFRHNNFSSYVPVDTNGDPINPFTIGLVTAEPNSIQAQKPWKVGDMAPSERAYFINSSSSFGETSTYSLMKPAEFYALMFDTLNLTNITANRNMRYDSNTKLRHTNNIFVHREKEGEKIVSSQGYNQYVSERLVQSNRNITNNYGGILRNVKPQLAHKQGSYIDFSSYKAQAESYSPTTKTTSIFIPTNNITHKIHVSPAIKNYSYSAVIIEKTATGFVVKGYDINRNYFETKVSQTTGPGTEVRVGGETINVPAFTPNQTLKVGQYVKYEGIFYKVKTEHVTSNSFVASNFQSVANVPMENGAVATYYTMVKHNETKIVDYGTEFENVQDVFDFLVNYGRQLESEGWVFDYYNSDNNTTTDWLYAAKEFLFWSIGGWGVGSVVALSPSANGIKFSPKQGIVANVEDIIGSTYSVLNSSGLPIDSSTTTATREGNVLTLTSDNREPIYFTTLYTREIEHISIFDNKTLFNDIIYNPTLSIRQPRLKQTVLKTKDWTGKLEASGYLISDTAGIIANFETSTRDINRYLDVEKPITNDNLKRAGLRTIGFSNRDYLENLQIIDENQAKFYQGYVKQKGSKNAIDRLTRTDVISERESLDVYEYYAFKVGEFGGTAVNESIEFKIDHTKLKTNPQLFSFESNIDGEITPDILTDEIITLDIDDESNWVKKPAGDRSNNELWTTRTEKFELPTAGYVNVADPTYQVYSKNDLNSHYETTSNVALGSTYWVNNDVNQDWNVYRLSQLGQSIDSITSINPLKVSVAESSGKLLTANASTVETVIPMQQNGTANVITMTHGSKLLQLELSDQSVTKTINFTDFAGSGAEVIADSVADKIAEIKVTTAGSGYTNGDTVNVSGAGGSGGSGTITTTTTLSGLTLVSGGSGYSTSSGITTTHADTTSKTIGSVSAVHNEINSGGLTIVDGGAGYTTGSYVVTGNFDGDPTNANVTWFVITTVSSVDGVTGAITGLNTFSNKNVGNSSAAISSGTKIVNTSLTAEASNTSVADITITGSTLGIIDSISFTGDGIVGDQTVAEAQANISISIGSGASITATGTEGQVASVSLVSGGGGFYAEPTDISILAPATERFNNITSANYYTSGSGTGAIFDIERSGSTYKVYANTFTNTGTNFNDNDIITVSGTYFGADSPANDLTIAINSTSGGAIGTFSVSGTASTKSKGSGAVLRMRGNRPVYKIETELSNPATNFSVGETLSSSPSNFTATVTGVYKYSANANVILYIDTVSGNFVTTTNDTYTGATSGAVSTLSNITTNTITTLYNTTSIQYGDETFGSLLSFKVANAGSNYVSPSLTVTANTGVAQGSLITSSGTITSAYVTTPGFGYRKEFAANANVQINIKDTVTNSDNKTITLSDQLIKPDSISNIVVTVNSAFDTSTGPFIDLDQGSNSSPIISSSNVFANTTITSGFTDITDRANSSVRLRLYGTNGTTGNATVTVNYKKASYNVLEPNATATVATAQDSAYMSGGTHLLYQYKDVRLASRRNGIDSGNVALDYSSTVNDFISNVCSSITFVSGDKVWLDDTTGDNIWYTLQATSNATIKSSYDNLASSLSIPTSVTIGGLHWIIYSDNDWDNSNTTVFKNTLRSNYFNKQVDTSLFVKSKLVDIEDYSRQTEFEIFDPVKNLIPGQAQRELNYISLVNPAVYNNNADNNLVTTSQAWDIEHVGKTWWDLSTVRYYEYENFDLEYRKAYWGKTTPGSTIDIYEWVESTSLPSDYSGDGAVLNTTDYTSVTTTDKQGFSNTKYYYWVKNRTVVPSIEGRSLSTTSISRLIKNPTSFGINWHSPIASNKLIIANSSNYISDDSLFSLNYKTLPTDQQTHKQWTLIKENDPDTLIDKRIWNKLNDSISGKDAAGLSVPDTTTLSGYYLYGNNIRPRQTWFKDVKEARRVFAYKTNKILDDINLDIEYPEWEKSFSTNSLIYDRKDYFISGYNNSIVINRTVDSINDIDTSLLNKNDVVKVNLDFNNKWAIYVYGDRTEILSGKAPVATANISDTVSSESTVSSGGYQSINIQSSGSESSESGSSNNELVRVANEKATINLNSSFYTLDDVANDTRVLLNQMYNYIFIGDRKLNLNALLFTMINYVFTEQSDIDWVIKSSYFDVVQKENSLKQQINYQADTFAYVKEYINEVKPYHGKLLNYVSQKQTTIENANVSATETFNIKNTLVFDRITANIELLDPTQSTTAQQLDKLIEKRTTANIASDGLAGELNYGFTNSAVERIAKYFYGDQLGSISTTNADQVTSFMNLVKTAVSPYKDLELEGLGFGFDKIVDSESVTTLGLDIDGYDSIEMSWDNQASQDWYTNQFASAKEWKSATAYNTLIRSDENGNTANVSMVKYTDLSHFNAWSTTTDYGVGDFVTYENKLYRCNVKHNAVDSGSTPYKTYTGDSKGDGSAVDTTILDWSKWDQINEYVYIAKNNHTANTFNSDYASGNWELVTTTFDGAGFVRPQHRDIPEEFIPTLVKETLKLTVITNETVTQNTDSITDATRANPTVITAAGHGLNNGDRITISGVGGMVELNSTFVVNNSTTNTFEIKHSANDSTSIDGSNFTPYTSGGTITHYDSSGGQYAYRIFYDPQGKSEYKRLPSAFETTLSATINASSKEIRVTDASVLYGQVTVGSVTVDAVPVTDEQPAYIWIDNELIEYREVNGNILSKIRRGVKGTTITDHANGTKVNSASSQHNIPNAKDSAYWSAQDSGGTALANATLDSSDQAQFIRQGGVSNFSI